MSSNAGQLGAALAVTDRSVALLYGVQLSSNSAAIQGGGVSVFQNSSLTLCDAVLADNAALICGGAIGINVRCGQFTVYACVGLCMPHAC